MESYSNILENKHKSKLKSNCKSLYLFKILEKHQIKYRYTCIYMQYSTYRDIDMTVERNGDIMDNSVVTPRNIRDKISYR